MTTAAFEPGTLYVEAPVTHRTGRCYETALDTVIEWWEQSPDDVEGQRVVIALGTVRGKDPGQANEAMRAIPHAWVEFVNNAGQWMALDRTISELPITVEGWASEAAAVVIERVTWRDICEAGSAEALMERFAQFHERHEGVAR